MSVVAMVIELTEENFEKHLQDEKLPILLMAYADWDCVSRCTMPVIEKIATELVGQVIVARINVSECVNMCRRFNIKLIPMFIVFKNGVEIRRQVGILGKDKCIQLLTETSAE